MADEETKKNEGKEEKQKPEKPKKSRDAGVSLPVLLGIIGGVLVIFMAFIYFLVLPYLVEGLGGDNTASAGANSEEVADSEGKNDGENPENEELSEFMADESMMHFVQTGRITTNPKQSSNFAVIDLGLEFISKEEIESHGEGGNIFSPKMNAKIKSTVTSVIGSYSDDWLLANRDSLSVILFDKLKPEFKDNDMLLKDVILQEFIIQ